MANDLGFQCKCGGVSGEIRDVSRGIGIRFVCHCDDCQVSALALGHPEALDSNGGTSAVLLDSSRLVIRHGLQDLAAMRVAKIKSRPVVRWFCSICKTPLFNTYDDARRSFLSFLLANSDGSECERLLGPSTGHVWKNFAVGETTGMKDASIGAILARMLLRQLSARISGDYKNTQLFDRRTNKPIVNIRLLTADERRTAEAIIARNRAGADTRR
jgi:hypothetical protein